MPSPVPPECASEREDLSGIECHCDFFDKSPENSNQCVTSYNIGRQPS